MYLFAWYPIQMVSLLIIIIIITTIAGFLIGRYEGLEGNDLTKYTLRAAAVGGLIDGVLILSIIAFTLLPFPEAKTAIFIPFL